MHRLRPLHRTLLMMAELFLGMKKARWWWWWECMAALVKVIPVDASQGAKKRPSKRVCIRPTIMNSCISEALVKAKSQSDSNLSET